MKRMDTRKLGVAGMFGLAGVFGCYNNGKINNVSQIQNAKSEAVCKIVTPEERERYENLKVSCSFEGRENGDYSAAGLIVSFSGSDTESDVLGVLDLRNVRRLDNITKPLNRFNSTINKHELYSMALRGSAPLKVYYTSDAWKQVQESDYLASRLETIFSPKLEKIVTEKGSEQEKDVRDGSLSILIPEKPEKGVYYFSVPRIAKR